MAVVALRRPDAGTSLAIDRDAISMTRHGVTKEAGEPVTSGNFDSLTHPVAITGQSVIGDQIRVPTAGCAMAGCEVAFADPAALGEADNRARAVAAGWARDDLGRLVCPACQHDRPVPPWWVYSQAPRPVAQQPRAASQERGRTGQERGPFTQERGPVTQERGPFTQDRGAVSDRRPAASSPWPADGLSQPPAPAPAPAGPPPVPGESRHHRAQWPRLLSALVNTRDGSAPRHEQPPHAAGHVRAPRA